MKPINCFFAGLLVLALASFGYSQSLADLAKKEKERREAVQANPKVITNDQTAKYSGAAVATGTPASAQADKPGSTKPAAGTDKPVAEGEAQAGAAGEKPASDEPLDFQGRPESFWRQTFADARQKVKELENESNVLVLKLNDLQNRFYRENDGYKQQAIQREIQKSFYEQDVNKENLAKAKSELAQLEVEARKSGALPGWIREPAK